jgi:hypothetical protein
MTAWVMIVVALCHTGPVTLFLLPFTAGLPIECGRHLNAASVLLRGPNWERFSDFPRYIGCDELRRNGGCDAFGRAGNPSAVGFITDADSPFLRFHWPFEDLNGSIRIITADVFPFSVAIKSGDVSRKLIMTILDKVSVAVGDCPTSAKIFAGKLWGVSALGYALCAHIRICRPDAFPGFVALYIWRVLCPSVCLFSRIWALEREVIDEGIVSARSRSMKETTI